MTEKVTTENSIQSIQSMGGEARRKALNNKQRSNIAKQAAISRWGSHATHKGNFKEEFGIDVECYVLNDSNKTAVISKRGMAAALGLNESSGQAFQSFAKSKMLSFAMVEELINKIDKPLIFKNLPTVKNVPKNVSFHGYDVTILIDICKAIIQAKEKGVLSNRYEKVAKNAQIIVNASAKVGIKGLVYALAGYDPTREEIITAFKLYVREEAREYEKEFPEQLYAEWYRLYQYQKPTRNRPWKFKHLTVEQVYHPLAKSRGKVYELTKNSKNNSQHKNERLHQFLSEVGVKALRQHLGGLIAIARISNTKEEYELNLNKLFGEPDKRLLS